MKDDFTVLIQNRTEFEKGNPATVFLSLPATKDHSRQPAGFFLERLFHRREQTD